MTNIYSMSQLIEERDAKDLRQLSYEYFRFIKDNEKRVPVLDRVEAETPNIELEDAIHDYLWNHFDETAKFTDTGRRININWGGDWSPYYGSKAISDIWDEELKKCKFKFYEHSSEENEDILSDNWRSVADAHIEHFSGKQLTKIMNSCMDRLPFDDAKSVAFIALYEFAEKVYKSGKPLKSRFNTAAWNNVLFAYREALDDKPIIRNKPSKKKLEDHRILTEFVESFKADLLREPSTEEICSGTGFGQLRVENTFNIFDMHIEAYRNMTEEEMLYDTMNEHLTERQSVILEMYYGMNGGKATIPEIAQELDVNEKTIRRDRIAAESIIKEQLGFKYNKQ